jgi:hypothetical protein
VWGFYFSADTADGTDPSTGGTTDTFFFDDGVGEQIFAFAGRTFFIEDVCFIFIAEIFKGGHNGVWSGLSEPA